MEQSSTKKVLKVAFLGHFLFQIIRIVSARVDCGYWEETIAHSMDAEFTKYIYAKIDVWNRIYNVSIWPAVCFLPVIILIVAVIGRYTVMEMLRIGGMGLAVTLMAFLVMLPFSFVWWPVCFGFMFEYMRSVVYWLIGGCFVGTFICWTKTIKNKNSALT